MFTVNKMFNGNKLIIEGQSLYYTLHSDNKFYPDSKV